MDSEIEIPTEEKPEQQKFLLGPGQRLHKAREKAHMGIKEVAAQLRLPVRVIEALENDDYRQTPAITFVKGYLRSYARLVSLSPDEVIEIFNQMGITDPNPVGVPTSKKFFNKQPSAGSGAVRWASYGLLALLVGMILIWLNSQKITSDVSEQIIPVAFKKSLSLTPERPSAANSKEDDSKDQSDVLSLLGESNQSKKSMVMDWSGK